MKAFDDFEKSFTKAKNLKDESISNFDIGINAKEQQQHNPLYNHDVPVTVEYADNALQVALMNLSNP